MRVFRQVFMIPAALCFAGLSSGVVQAALPQGQYACQVLTVAGEQGVVLAQANTREEAQNLAPGALALTVNKSGQSVASVVECIRLPQEQFRDTYFQQVFETIPR